MGSMIKFLKMFLSKVYYIMIIANVTVEIEDEQDFKTNRLFSWNL